MDLSDVLLLLVQAGSLPFLPTWSLILLKFLLAVIGVNNPNPGGSGMFPNQQMGTVLFLVFGRFLVLMGL